MSKIIAATLVLLAIVASPVRSQSNKAWDPTGLQLSRTELQDLLKRYEATASSTTYGNGIKDRAHAEAGLIAVRLKEGDIKVGDRISLSVEGQKELSDSFTVATGRIVLLPNVGEIKLEGILRSELESYLATQIAKFYVNPVVHARSLIRLEIRGAVGAPGYYNLPSDLLITDALMKAGGPSPSAAPNSAIVQRGDQTIWTAADLRQSIIEGRTLDQISVQAGDALVVPLKASAGQGVVKSVLVAISTFSSVFLIYSKLKH